MAIDKAIDSTQLDAGLTSVANAIRTKGGTSAALAFPADFVSAIAAIPTGGGVVEADWNDVNFWDYDGTLLYSYSAADFANLSALPANPSHDGLTAQGWNWTLSDAKTHVATYGMLDIGQLYIPTDGKTRLYITVDDPLRMNRFLNLKCSVASSMTLDWGDGSATETNTGTSNATYTHTYTALGNYVIKISVSSGTLTLRGNLMRGSSNAYWSSSSLTAVEIGNSVALEENAFRQCYQLKTITMPTSVTYPNNKSLFEYTPLSMIVLPAAYGTGEAAGFRDAQMRAVCLPKQTKIRSSWSNLVSLTLRRVCIPVQFNGNQGMNGAKSMTKFPISTDCTKLYTQGIVCNSLVTLTIPSSVATIDNSAILDVYSLKEVHMLGTTPPTLSGTSNFTNHPSDFVIYVPYSVDQSILNSYKTATNWSSFANYMQEEPQ